MIYVLKIIWDYRVPLLELIVRNIARYPQSATNPLYAIYYLVYSTVLENEKKEIKQEWKEGPEMFYSTLLAMAFTYVRGPPAGPRPVLSSRCMAARPGIEAAAGRAACAPHVRCPRPWQYTGRGQSRDDARADRRAGAGRQDPIGRWRTDKPVAPSPVGQPKADRALCRD